MRLRVSRQNVPVLATLVVLVVLYVAAGLMFDRFFSMRVLANFFSENAFLGIVAVGATFVIICGGIDLSVGAVVGCTTICSAVLIARTGLHPLVAFGILLAGGTLLGAAQGALIHKFGLQPFLVTLAGLFFCRGVGLWVSTESVQVDHPFLNSVDAVRLPVAKGAWLPSYALLFLVVLFVAAYVAKFTRFGRTVYAIGGNEQSAVLMGLRVARTKVAVYALSGFCAALGGVAFVLYTSAGNAINGTGLELDTIATVVIGGTLLTGGYGSVFGTLFGLLTFAVIQSAIMFEGTLSSWWSRIATGTLLLLFILLQRALQREK